MVGIALANVDQGTVRRPHGGFLSITCPSTDSGWWALRVGRWGCRCERLLVASSGDFAVDLQQAWGNLANTLAIVDWWLIPVVCVSRVRSSVDNARSCVAREVCLPEDETEPSLPELGAGGVVTMSLPQSTGVLPIWA